MTLHYQLILFVYDCNVKCSCSVFFASADALSNLEANSTKCEVIFISFCSKVRECRGRVTPSGLEMSVSKYNYREISMREVPLLVLEHFSL